MWRRNLLFGGVCLVGVAALAAGLSPVHAPPRHRRSLALPAADLPATVARLDESFTQSWSAANVIPSPKADDLAIARRLSLALAGTIPSLAEMREFEAHPATDRIAWWVSSLLADRRSSDLLAERFARALVGTEDGPFLVYRRRRFVSWLSDQIHENRRYDELVRELIASEGLWTDHPATNFVTVTVQPDQERGPDANRLAGRTARALLGMRLDCAECHDHPFAEWEQRDFQSLAGFFSSVDNTLRGLRDVDRPARVEDNGTGEWREVSLAVPFSAELLPDAGPARERLAAWVTHPENKAFSRAAANRVWAILFGRPLVEPIDSLPPTGDVPEPLNTLAEDFVSHGYDLRRMITLVALSAPFARDSRETSAAAEDSAGFAPPTAEMSWAEFPLTRLRPEQVVGSLLQAASLETIDHESHILVRFARATGQAEFIKRYGDSGEEEFAPQAGTIPQQLLLMNGDLVEEKTKDNLIGNAASQIAALASSDEVAVETAYLATLTRRPTAAEQTHFAARLNGSRGAERRERMQDLYWALINSAEFSWNH